MLRFLTDLPSRCEPRNAFELQVVDPSFLGFGPFEVFSVDSNAAPGNSVTQLNSAKLRRRKKFGSSYSTHQLFSANQNACITVADLPEQTTLNVRTQACATADGDFNDQSFEVVPVEAHFGSIRLVWRNHQGSEGQSCLGINTGLSAEKPPFIQLFGCNSNDSRQYFEIVNEPNRGLPGVLSCNRNSDRCLLVPRTVGPAEGPDVGTAACDADDPSQRWWARSSYLDLKYDGSSAAFRPQFEFAHGPWTRE